jgi:hypothetical protein
MLSLELSISNTGRETLFFETNNFIKKHNLHLYKSEVISYIDGIQALSAHLTIFYGLTELQNNHLDDLKKLSDICNSLALIKKINLKGSQIIIKNGYQSLYSILLLKLDTQNNIFLEQAYTALSNLPHYNVDTNLKNKDRYEPHITLAYIQKTSLSSKTLNLTNFSNLESLDIGKVNLVF